MEKINLNEITELVAAKEYALAKEQLLKAEEKDLDALKLLGLCNINLENFKEAQSNYETIVKKLKMYVNVDDEGISNFYAPTVIVVKNGEVIAFFDDATIVKGNMTPEIYFTEYKKGELYEQFKLSITEYLE